jgi:signal transduction histidine kinase
MLETPSNAPPGENGQMGVGIPGMRQRLTQLGGRLEIESTDHGTTITVLVPVNQKHALGRSGF